MVSWITSACFPAGALDPPLIATVLSKFEPVLGSGSLTYKANTRRTSNFDTRAISRLAQEKSVESFRVDGKFGAMAMHGLAGWSADIVDVEDVVPGPWCEHLVRLPAVNAVYSGDADDAFWQSERNLNSYKVFGRATDELTTVTDGSAIDISHNPGRRVAVPGMWLWAAATMWFGSGAFEFIDRQNLLSFPGASALNGDETTDIVRVQLFDVADPIEAIRARQRAFQEWIGFDAIESAVRSANSQTDVRLEIESGNFEHGGVRLLTQFLGSDGATPVGKCKASARRIVELGEDGSILSARVESLR